MQIKLDLYVSVYIVQAFLLDASLKPHTALLVVCLLGQKLGDNEVSLSQLNAVSTFSYGKVFHKTFFHQNTQGCFS